MTAVQLDDFAVLFEASARLTQAATPAELLEAVSSYAREHGASSGTLIYLHPDESNPIARGEIVAEWVRGNIRPIGLGVTVRYDEFPSVTNWLNSAEPLLFIEDLRTDARFDPQARARSLSYNRIAAAVLALYNQGRRVGLIYFGWDSPRRYNERDKRIYTALIHQAAPVIDAQRLLELSHVRAARAELLLRINTELSRATNEAEIVEALLPCWGAIQPYSVVLSYLDVDATGKPIAATNVAVWTDGRLRPDDHRIGEATPLNEYGLPRLWTSQPDSLLLIPDIEAEKKLSEHTRNVSLSGGIRSLVLLPLHSGGRWQGIVQIKWRVPRRFPEDEIYIYRTLLQTLPSVIASRRAYLAEEEARRESELLYRISKAINAANTFDEIAQAVSVIDPLPHSIALSAWENYDFNGATYFEIVAVSGRPVQEVGTRYALDDFPIARSPSYGYLTVMEDIANDPTIDTRSAASWLRLGTRARLGVALVVNNRWMGVLAFLSDKPRKYTEREKRLAAGVGDLVAAALDRIRLKKETEESARQAERRAQELAVLEERNRLARELHDSVSQALYGIGLGARTAGALLDRDPSRLREPLEYILTLTEAGLAEMRALIFELRPESIENEGLISALSKQAAAIQARHNIHVQTEFCEEPALPLHVKESLYRVAREALHNIVKHARASRINLSLTSSGKGFRLCVADNGVGFDPSDSFPGHLGLQSMRERVARLHGTLDIRSVPGQGTQIAISIPPYDSPLSRT